MEGSTEKRLTALMIAHSFSMGIATVLFETAASATFLSRFSAADLPWVYIVAALLNAGSGFIYVRVQQRIRFASLMKGTLWALLLLVLAIRTGHAVSTAGWIAFGALVAYRIISSLTDLEYWAVASRIYDIGQARRLFGVVGTGEVVARTAGAFCVPFLVAHGGVNNLMLWSAGGLAGCIFIVGRILHQDLRPVPSRPSRPSTQGAATTPYLAVVIGVAALATFGKFFVDFAFLEQISSLKKSETDLASLLGILSGTAQGISLLLRVFVSRPLLARVGIRTGVIILPIAHALCTLFVIGSGFLGASGYLFAFVALNQGIYKALKHPIDNAAFKVLYQPLAMAQRFAAQVAVEVVWTPVIVAIAGIIMLLFAHHWDATRFACMLLVVVIMWAAAARVAGRRYEGVLLDRLSATGDLRTRVGVALEHLKSPSPEKRAVAREVLDVLQRGSGEQRAVVTALINESSAP